MSLTLYIKEKLVQTLSEELLKRNGNQVTHQAIDEELLELEYELANSIWEKHYGLYDFTLLPDELIIKQSYLRVCVEVAGNQDITMLRYGKSRPSKHNLVIEITKNRWEKKAAAYLKLKEYKQSLANEMRIIGQDARIILKAINTSKQLEDIWPEAFALLPASEKGTSVISLSEIRSINEKLGL